MKVDCMTNVETEIWEPVNFLPNKLWKGEKQKCTQLCFQHNVLTTHNILHSCHINPYIEVYRN